MINKFELNLSNTKFVFTISRREKDDGGLSWTNASIIIKNRYFNYEITSEFLTYDELKVLYENLKRILHGSITEKTVLKFIEPYLVVSLNPKSRIRNSSSHGYANEVTGVDDISVELLLFLSPDGVLTEQHYVLPLYREEILMFTNFLGDILDII